MSLVKKYVFVFASIILSVKSFAQAPSPYTTFGIGEPYGDALVNTQGMGGVGVAQPQFWFINNQNPALLVYNGLTSFQAGIVMEQRTLKGTTDEKFSGGNMNYLITAFPVLPPRRIGETTRWTTSIGLMPLTSVNYKMAYTDSIEGSSELVNIREEGTGGLTQLFWSNGFRISNDFSIGAKISYVFSSITNSYKNQLPSTASPIGYYTTVEEQTYVRDLQLSFGASFSKDSLFNKNYRLSVGITAEPGLLSVFDNLNQMSATRTTQFFRENAIGEVMENDTLAVTKGKLFIPPAGTIGISLSRGLRWSVATEFRIQDWSTFKSFSTEDEGLAQAWRWSLGGELTPNVSGTGNFLSRMTYRLGATMERTPYMAPFENPQPVNDYGATFGVSLPAGRSAIDFAFKYGTRGDKEKNILAENYFRIYVGIVFNDQWFIKRKFD